MVLKGGFPLPRAEESERMLSLTLMRHAASARTSQIEGSIRSLMLSSGTGMMKDGRGEGRRDTIRQIANQDACRREEDQTDAGFAACGARGIMPMPMPCPHGSPQLPPPLSSMPTPDGDGGVVVVVDGWVGRWRSVGLGRD